MLPSFTRPLKFEFDFSCQPGAETRITHFWLWSNIKYFWTSLMFNFVPHDYGPSNYLRNKISNLKCLRLFEDTKKDLFTRLYKKQHNFGNFHPNLLVYIFFERKKHALLSIQNWTLGQTKSITYSIRLKKCVFRVSVAVMYGKTTSNRKI